MTATTLAFAKHGLQATMLSDRTLAVTNGVIRWIDQSENHQRRSEPGYVLGAIQEHIGP